MPVFQKPEVEHRERRRDQRQAADPAVTAGEQRRDPSSERVARDRGHAFPDRLRQRVERGRGVVLLGDAAPVHASGGTGSPEIEAQGGQAELAAHLLSTHHDRIVHVTPIQWMGMTDHHTGGCAWGDGQAAFQDYVAAHREADGLLGYHVPP